MSDPCTCREREKPLKCSCDIGHPKRQLIEGMAECTFNEGLETEIAVGDMVYIREISNMREHCVVLRHGASTTLVGIHLDRFRILGPEE